VQRRRYRFRILDGGPSRFYELYLTNPDNPNQSIPYYAVADDGNLLPAPVRFPTSSGSGVRLGVAERADIIIDFNAIARDLADAQMERSTRETLTASERSQLARVNRALSKLENGTYGLSDITGEPIPLARLEALPWATTNVEDESLGA